MGEWIFGAQIVYENYYCTYCVSIYCCTKLYYEVFFERGLYELFSVNFYNSSRSSLYCFWPFFPLSLVRARFSLTFFFLVCPIVQFGLAELRWNFRTHDLVQKFIVVASYLMSGWAHYVCVCVYGTRKQIKDFCAWHTKRCGCETKSQVCVCMVQLEIHVHILIYVVYSNYRRPNRVLISRFNCKSTQSMHQCLPR